MACVEWTDDARILKRRREKGIEECDDCVALAFAVDVHRSFWDVEWMAYRCIDDNREVLMRLEWKFAGTDNDRSIGPFIPCAYVDISRSDVELLHDVA